MLKAIIVMFKGASRVKWWINIDAFDLPRKLLFQRLQRQQIVAKNEPVVKDVFVRHTLRRMIGLLLILQQNPRLQPRPILLPDPR